MEAGKEGPMATFMDVHNGFVGVSAEEFQKAHEADLAVEDAEGVHYGRAWLDPVSGKAFCLVTGPSKEAVMPWKALSMYEQRLALIHRIVTLKQAVGKVAS